MTISCSQTFFPKNHNRRIISLQGTSNFRDVGGYRGLNRQKTSWGVLYRSADLAQLSSSDLTQLQALGLQISIDLRSNLERQMRPYDYPFLKTILCSVEPKVTDSVMAAMMHGQSLSTQQADTFMHTMYEDFVFGQQAAFRKFFDIVLQHSKPIAVHCTAGKDRTGYAIALLLLALGVHQDDVLEDYLLTQQALSVDIEKLSKQYHLPPNVLQILWGVKLKYLTHSLNLIEKHFGGFNQYMQQNLNLTSSKKALLQKRFLQ